MKAKLVAVLTGSVLATDFDYCSIQHSQLVAEDVDGYFLEAFREFGVPMSSSCPF